MSSSARTLVLLGGVTAIVASFSNQAAGQVAANSCPVTVTAPSFGPGANTALTVNCASSTSTGCTNKSGTVVDTSNRIALSPLGGNFQSTQLTIATNISFAAVGDFNKDGWPDFVGAAGSAGANSPGYVFQNQTWQSENCTTPACTAYSGAQPNWASQVITPKFVTARNLHSTVNYNGLFQFGAGDFNGDGWDDIVEFYAPCSGTPCSFTTMNVYLNSAANSTANCPTGTSAPYGGCAQFAAAYDGTTASTVALKNGTVQEGDYATSTQVLDYDGDGHLDILLGSNENNGSVRILLGSCTNATPLVVNNGLKKCASGSNPTFVDGGFLIKNLKYLNTYTGSGTTVSGFGTGANAQVVFYYGDFDADGMKDLIVGSPNCCSTVAHRGRIFKGCAAPNVPSPGTCGPMKLETTASQYLPGTGLAATTASPNGPNFPGAADVMLVNDFTLDGKVDLLLGTDAQSTTTGGESWMWKNTGTSAPFSANSTQVTYRGSSAGQATDYDVGFLFDYDQDPNHTADAFVADGNDSGNYYILENKVASTYVSCGDVYGTVPLDANAAGDAVVTGARISAVFDASGAGESVNFYASNEDPPNWVGPLAHCSSAPTSDYCASFPKPVGKTVRWKATLCGNSYDTPTLTSVTEKYDYTEATDHYRSGVVVNDGVAYVGAFRQPGDRGRMYAMNGNLSGSPLWESSTKLDAMSDASRNIFTSVNGASVAFTAANASASAAFQSMLGATSTTAPQVVTWARSARFGLGTTASPLSKLGSVITSSPAVLSKPGRPNWYIYSTTTERSYIDAFVTGKSGARNTSTYRVPLALVGSKDGMVHAFYTTPSLQTDTTHNGPEAWAYVPPTVANGMLADMNTMNTTNAAATDGENHPIATKYPDGSPTLFDYYNGGTAKTVAMVAEGYGGRSFSVFDVTQTVDPVSGSVTGPTPMWSGGETTAGYAFAKPILARVKVAGLERFFTIVASGYDPNDATPSPATTAKGRIVTAYDVADGSVMWRFQAKCAVSSELTAFETDDTSEPGSPTLDGYVDRVVFADSCGNVYKVNPAQTVASGGYVNNTGYGTISVGAAPDGAAEYALFSTTSTTNAVGGARFIAGTIGARIDSSTRMILYFGTGGIESQAQNLVNEFYAVYADTGAIRSKYTGTCTGGICEKFYGGVVVTPTQVVFTRTVDAQIATNTCDDGSSVIQAYEVNPTSGNAFVSDFAVSSSAAVMGSLFAASGAVYYSTLNGDVSSVGATTSPTAGYDTLNSTGQGTGTGQNGTNNGAGGSTSMTLVGWRIVL